MADLVKNPELVQALIVTVGTSALMKDQSDKRPDLGDRSLPDDAKEFVRDLEMGEVDPERIARLEDRLVQEHLAYWQSDKRFIETRLPYTSAELSSTLQLVHWYRCQPARLLLLCTATEDGQLAGRVNARVFRAQAGTLLPAGVSVELLAEPARGRDLVDWYERIDDLMGGKDAEEAAIVNITGGFKGLVPAMTMLAIRRGWLLYYQHETHLNRGYLQAAPERIERTSSGYGVIPGRRDVIMDTEG